MRLLVSLLNVLLVARFILLNTKKSFGKMVKLLFVLDAHQVNETVIVTPFPSMTKLTLGHLVSLRGGR